MPPTFEIDPVSSSARWKGAFVGALVLVATLLCSAVLYFRATNALQKEVQDKLMRTAMAIAAQVDGDLHRTFTDRSQEAGADYARALKPLRDALYWREDGKLLRTDFRYIYTCILKDGAVYFVLDPTPAGQIRPDGVEEQSHIMQLYPDASEGLLGTLQTGRPTADRYPYKDQWGIFVSGYAPFYDSAGKQAGVVGVDWQAETYAGRLAGIRSAWYLQVFLCLVIGLLSGSGTSMVLGRRERAEAAQRHAFEEARRNRERWRIMVETLPKPAAHLQDGELWINEPLEKCLGCARGGVTSLDRWFALLRGEDAAQARACYEADRAGGFARSREIRVRTADGREKIFEFTAHAYNPGEVWLLDDITEEKAFKSRLIAAREEAEAAVKAKGIFLATVSHEVRTPMNGVIGMTNLLLESPLAPHQREMAETIRSSGEALVVVINDILDYSKIESGGMELEAEPFDLRSCVEDCLDLFAGLAAEKGLVLLAEPSPGLPAAIRGDCARLRQVLCNLIGNAIKFTERGEVEVRVSAEAGDPANPEGALTLRVAVRDTGIGIPTDRLDRLFRSFSQADSSTARKYGGTGLGLAISRRLVELMGGVIAVESAPGRGSTFSFAFPTTAEPAVSGCPEAPAVLAGKRVLVVEAHAGVAEAIASALRRAGMVCVVALDVEQAWVAVRREMPWDLLLVDLQMPGGGLDWWRQACEGLASPPAGLGISSLVREAVREEALTAGLARVLQKPVRTAMLWQSVSEAITPGRPPSPPPPAATGGKLADQHPLRILIAEDNRVNRLVSVRMLERFGYRPDIAEDGYEAVRMVGERTYDVVFMDVQMPGLNGYQATRRIGELLPAERRPWIVALTANAMNDDRETCLRHGMDDYVAKPIRLTELDRALRAVPVRGGVVSCRNEWLFVVFATMGAHPFRVQVVAQENLEYFRDAVLGVRRHGFSTGRMVFADRWLDHEIAGDLKRLVKRDGIQGIVATIHTAAQERRFAALGVPVVNISNSLRNPRLPVVTQDDVAVGRLAAEHLQACGCRAFGFWGQTGASYSEERMEGFREVLGKKVTLSFEGCADGVEATAQLYARMRGWLAKQVRPLGLFAVLDTYALLLMRAARELGWRVPEDVAVLGAGDEDFWVEFESVPLSSVRLPARQIGHEAALLDRMMVRRVIAAKGRRLAGAAIVARPSTDVIYAEDEAVARAVRFIREQAAGNPYVGDVAKAAGVSRSALQARFREALGRTVLAEIQRVRVGRAQELLAHTELKLSVVAERCGFPNSQRFSVLFRQVAGLSPSAYRRQFRRDEGGGC